MKEEGNKKGEKDKGNLKRREVKVWWPYATLFVYFFIFLLQYIHLYNHSNITFAEVLLHIFIAAGSVGGTSLSRDSNSGLPYSKPAHFQLSCAAP
jgi:hypothetical protein